MNKQHLPIWMAAIFSFCWLTSFAQPNSCGPITNTGVNHTIIFSNATVTLDNNPLPNGSFIIVVFDDNGTMTCSGFTEWEGNNTSIAAFGDDSITPNKDGFADGEPFKFRVELPNGTVIGDSNITVTYYPVGGIFGSQNDYITNGISGIQALAASTGATDCPILNLNFGDTCNDGDACTANDSIDVNCNCIGTFQDSDNDGTCDADDVCPNSPEPGASCDDGDPTTIDDEIDTNCNCVGAPSCRIQDSLVLIALYNATGGTNWATNWNLADPISTWHGITLNNLGCVIEIDLADNNLNGAIPSQLGQLANLSKLHLGTKIASNFPPLNTNQLTGNIPADLGGLSNLELLNLSSNQLTGSIPSELGQLSNLIELWLNFNNLMGSIPPELGQLASLEVLQIGANGLTGNIPPELGQLSNVKRLVLDNCLLQGSIPPELGQLNQMDIYLGLGNNQLTGNIPPELGQLANLNRLNLRNNQLNGSIPSELGLMLNLTNMSIYNNQLTGSIPTELGQLSKLRILRLQNNQLTGSIPSEFGQLTELIFIELQNNLLTGNIPPELGMLNLLIELDLSNNNLEGPIPGGLGLLSSLTKLHLNDNNLSGCYPVFTNSICQLIDYDFTNNPLLPFQGDYTQICNGEDEIGSFCDDGDTTTINDQINVDCLCEGTTPVCTGIGDADGDGVCTGFDCNDNDPQATETIGTPCNDGDPCTENDQITAGCGCSGTFADDDNDGTCNAEDVCPNSPEPGATCDDGNTCTLNDTIDTTCNCVGTFQDSDNDGTCDADDVCPNSPEPGASCDDGDPNTLGDTVQPDCSCLGSVDFDCPVLNLNFGDTCDDGYACTVNDAIDFNCNCIGIFQDTDNDGTCDANDICPGSPEPGTSCDDSDPTTTNTTVQNDCSCGGGILSSLNLTCPQNISITIPSGQSSGMVNYNQPATSSNCPTGNINLSMTAGLPSGSSFPIGTTVVSYLANDDCGNSKTCSFDITVMENQGTLDCNNVAISATSSGTMIVEGLIAPVNEIQVITGDWSHKEFSCLETCNSPVQQIFNLPPGLYHVLIKFYSANYQLICSRWQDITVGGGNNTFLTLTCPDNITVMAAMNQTSAIVHYDLPDVFSTCTTGSPSISQVSGLPSGSSFPAGTTLVRFTASDPCGNVNDCSFLLTVNTQQGGNPDCSSIGFSTMGDSIIISNLNAPITEVQLITGDWSNKLFRCFGDCDVPELTLPDLAPDIYHLIVKFYTAD